MSKGCLYKSLKPGKKRWKPTAKPRENREQGETSRDKLVHTKNVESLKKPSDKTLAKPNPNMIEYLYYLNVML